MSESYAQESFQIPAFRPFVPRWVQPWIYVIFAFLFQLSGGRYIGALDEMMGDEARMREDELMCLYCTLAGMAVYFPLLFRMKFRFTNKTLLTTSALGLVMCNWLSMHVTSLPVLWGICFVAGCLKLQGTFECLSNIQLWMTPRRDFTVFFPILHLFILGAIQVSDYMTAWFASRGVWQMAHWVTIGLMLVMLIVLQTCTRHFRFMRRFPLVGIDWAGMALWTALLLQEAYIFDYGGFYDWGDSSVIRSLVATSLATFGAALWRMFTVRHPFIEPRVFSARYVKPILLLITVVEAIMGSEYVLEEVFLAEGMHYDNITSATLDGAAVTGVIVGCLFALWWMKVMRFSYVRLIIVGLVMMIAYLVGMYFLITPAISREMLAAPVFCRSVATALFSIAFLTSLHDVMEFHIFFQSLAVFQALHMVVGGLIGTALYSEWLKRFIADGFSRYGTSVERVSVTALPIDFPAFMSRFTEEMQMVGVKRLYGCVAYATIALLILFLLYDAPARRDLKRMPSWKSLGQEMRRSLLGR